MIKSQRYIELWMGFNHLFWLFQRPAKVGFWVSAGGMGGHRKRAKDIISDPPHFRLSEFAGHQENFFPSEQPLRP